MWPKSPFYTLVKLIRNEPTGTLILLVTYSHLKQSILVKIKCFLGYKWKHLKIAGIRLSDKRCSKFDTTVIKPTSALCRNFDLVHISEQLAVQELDCRAESGRVESSRAGSLRYWLHCQAYAFFYSISHTLKSNSFRDILSLEVPYMTVEKCSRLRARSKSLTLRYSSALHFLNISFHYQINPRSNGGNSSKDNSFVRQIILEIESN